jgi:hypothetical protein
MKKLPIAVLISLFGMANAGIAHADTSSESARANDVSGSDSTMSGTGLGKSPGSPGSVDISPPGKTDGNMWSSGNSDTSSGDTSSGDSGTSTGEASSGASAAGVTSGSNADTAADDEAVQNLRAAAQSVRDAVQRLQQMPAGAKRAEAIREANEALMKVHSAIAELPPHLHGANVNESNYRQAMDKLKQASDRLYAAADALANQPPGKGTDAAIGKVNQALMQTNEAMLTGLQQSAQDMTGRHPGATSSGDSSGGGSAERTGRPPANTVDLGKDDDRTDSGGTSSSSTGADDTLQK